MKTHSVLNNIFVVLLCTVLAFVCIARPLQARADSGSMDYVVTDMSTSDVKALFTGASAIVPAAIMIIGFIVMCYCVLRNVEVPLDFSDQTSFSDKLTQLGQYAIDNATDDIKDFLYSVYTYANDNGITSILGLTKFVGLQASKFFGAITNWIGGSLIQNRTNIGNGLLNNFTHSALTYANFALYQYSSAWNSTFYSLYPLYNDYNSYSCIPQDYVTSVRFSAYRFDNYYLSGLYLVVGTSDFAFYTLDVDNNVFVRTAVQYYYLDGLAYRESGYLYYPSSGGTEILTTSSSFPFSNNGNRLFSISEQLFMNLSVGVLGSFAYNGQTRDASTISPSVLNPATTTNDVLNPAVDNVYVPTDVWNIDIVGTWEQIARDVSATYDQTERIAAFVGDIPLTLTSAQSYAPTINDAGNYVFPDFGTVWKYPQYFFDTLSGWGMFVGNCLRAVTVDEGGLSWIFYGGFVLLVCGGIIGKILMG